jgi:hypothetical protein
MLREALLSSPEWPRTVWCLQVQKGRHAQAVSERDRYAEEVHTETANTLWKSVKATRNRERGHGFGSEASAWSPAGIPKAATELVQFQSKVQ